MNARGLIDACIARPVATTLLALGGVLLGVLAYQRLPIAPLPEAEFPSISVSANLPGASAETMASAVATPLEVALSAVPGITEMTSSSSLGSTSITMQFTLSKSLDTAAQEVQAAINSVAGRLPREMPNLPTWRKVNPTDGPILVLWVQSEAMDLTELTDIVESRLARQLSQLEGVAEIFVTGGRRPALRIGARPESLAARDLTLADLRAAVLAASTNQAKGALYGDSQLSTLAANDQLTTAEEYRDIIVAYRDGQPVRLADLANVDLGPENAYVAAWQNGKPGINLIIRRQPGANIVATADRILAALPALREQLPASIDIGVLNDRTRTIRSSLAEVEFTLLLTFGLVVVVMGLFLRQVSATIIVGIVLGLALVATFGAMYVFGFSLNNLTLLALIIAVGFVVDDAIVVIENIHRYLEQGMSRVEAARRGASEVAFTVVSISVSLIAAFVPLLFMGGVIGRLFREFSLVVAAAILLSVITSLTIAPMLAARHMRPLRHAAHEGWSARLTAAYGRSLQWALRHRRLVGASFLAAVVATVVTYKAMPKGFFPEQDTAFIIGTTQGAQDISYQDMVEKHRALADIVAQEPGVSGFASAVGPTGGSQMMSSGRFWIVLKDRNQRDVSVQEFIARLRPKLAKVPGIVLYMRASQDINLGSFQARTQYSYLLKSTDTESLAEWATQLTAALQKTSGFVDVSNDLQRGAAVTELTIDRQAAARFGVTVRDIGQMLYDAFGQRQIGEYQTETNQYRLVLEVASDARGRRDTLQLLHLRSATTGELVPLSALVQVKETTGASQISHHGLFPSVNVSFNLQSGFSLGQAVAAIEKLRGELRVPSTVVGQFSGSAQAFKESLATQPLLILLALIAVYIILGVLYESYVHPLTILSTLPSAGLGALVTLWLAGFDFSIMALIGIVLLIGIVKKNGIMMIDFALQAERVDGKNPNDAIFEACVTRFRPIMMTTLTALLAAIPLMIGFGTGAELRQPLGFAVVGGLVVSQVLTLYSTPVVYLWLHRFTARA